MKKLNSAALRFALLLTMTAIGLPTAVIPALGQNTVPPTAREAAALPAFASRLHPRATPKANKSAASARARIRPRSPQDQVLYENGPINGNTDAWGINFGYVVADSFTLGSQDTVTGFDFWAWEFPGDSLSSVDWSITSTPFGGTTYASGTASGSNLSDVFVSSNSYGYNIDMITVSNLNVQVAAGTYYLNLQNATLPSGDPIYWDENSGVGCNSPGCPSLADQNEVGTIPSESFDVTGSSSTSPPPPPPCFDPEGNLKIIHDFTEGEKGTYGVVSDKAGNVYGTAEGGDNGLGFVYKLSPKGQDWVFTSLYSFAGGYNGFAPYGLVIGPDGALYGAASGGIQNCGYTGTEDCGLVFRLRPSPNACRTSQCSWTEEVLYRFTDSDAWEPYFLVPDQAGNLYGRAIADPVGYTTLLFKLTPSNTGWTEKVLYDFNNGDNPGALLLGKDGNFYTISSDRIFQVAPSGGGWTETLLYTFQDSKSDGEHAGNMLQDSSGNLYGTSSWGSFWGGPLDAMLWKLSPSGGKWTFTAILADNLPAGFTDVINNLAIDSAGNLYGTGVFDLAWHCRGYGCLRSTRPSDYYYPAPYVFRGAQETNGWQFWDTVFYYDTNFPADGALALDGHGNLFGTTDSCGKYGTGTVWQVSP